MYEPNFVCRLNRFNGKYVPLFDTHFMWMREKSSSLSLCASDEWNIYIAIPLSKNLYNRTNEQRKITITIKCLNILCMERGKRYFAKRMSLKFQSKKKLLSVANDNVIRSFLHQSLIHRHWFLQMGRSIAKIFHNARILSVPVCQSTKMKEKKKNICKAQNEIVSSWLPQWWRAIQVVSIIWFSVVFL